MLKALKEKGKTVIIVTHDVELIKNACTYMIPFGEIARRETSRQ
jgi:energy-coupling factor transport system ATP-binding protein